MRAIRSATSGCIASGSLPSTAADRLVGRFASTSAIIWWDSLRSSVAIRSTGTRRRNSNGRVSGGPAILPSSSAARSGPSARSITSRANSIPPSAPAAAAPAAAISLKTESVVSAPTGRSRAISGREALDLLLAQPLRGRSRRARSRARPSGRPPCARLRPPGRRAALRSGPRRGPAGVRPARPGDAALRPSAASPPGSSCAPAGPPGRGRCRRAARPGAGSRRPPRAPLPLPLPTEAVSSPGRAPSRARARTAAPAPRARAASAARGSSPARACAASAW